MFVIAILLGMVVAQVELPRKGKELDQAISLAMESNAHIQRRVAHTGWYDGRRSFVTHHRVVGNPRIDEPVIPPDFQANQIAAHLAEEGSATDFLKKIAPFATL